MLLIEVGAYDGEDSLSYHKRGYTVFTFEPKKDLYENLVKKTAHLSNYTVIPKAVCLTNGKAKFNICVQGGASSLLEFRKDSELDSNWGPGRKDIHFSGISYEVETIRLDTFIEESGLQDTNIDFLHIDAQGVDLDVLKSLGTYITNLKAGVVETVILQERSIYVNQIDNTFSNVSKFLEENGFIIENIVSNDVSKCEYNILFKRKE
jgi:FkbM family methyltransferase